MMSNYLSLAGLVTILLGLVHSVLGEWLVFRKLRDRKTGQWIVVDSILPLRSTRILWASWHIVTVLAFAIGIILFSLDPQSDFQASAGLIKNTLLLSMLCCAVLVLIGTKASHPGWLVLS